MLVTVDRKYKKEDYTIGRLHINGQFICNTLEDRDRGLTQGMSEEIIQRIKVYGETAIPSGRYEVDMDTISPSFSKKKYYKEFCNGKLPRLKGVKGFEGILIHRGTNADHTYGCILVGDNTKKGKLTNSKERFEEIYKLLREAADKGEKIWLSIY